MITIIRKELADYFTSIRCYILFILVILASAAGLFAAYEGIRGVNIESGFVFLNLFTTSGENIPSLVTFIGIFVPIIGIALGFDAINREYSSGTMSRILSQPIFRDSVINGKFLAGIITLAIMMATTLLLVSGFGLRMIGVPPGAEEIIRLFIFFVSIVIYGAFWMGLAILFSVLAIVHEKTDTSAATSSITKTIIWIFRLKPRIVSSCPYRPVYPSRRESSSRVLFMYLIAFSLSGSTSSIRPQTSRASSYWCCA